MKLSQWAKKQGICYATAWRMFKNNLLSNAYQLPTGTIIVEDDITNTSNKTAIYARVSSSENKDNLDSQAERLKSYCIAKGYQINQIVKETASGLNDERPKLERLLLDNTITTIVVEHKDRLARFGFNYINKLLKQRDRKIEVVNVAENAESDLMSDFVSIITSFTARLYGKRRSHRKTEKIIDELNKQ
jgi:predicted site-specific integrase-resolvase